MGLLIKEHKTTTNLDKGSSLSLMKPLDPNANFQEVRRTEDHSVQLHHVYASSKIQIKNIFILNSSGLLTNRFKKKEKEGWGEL